MYVRACVHITVCKYLIKKVINFFYSINIYLKNLYT